MPLAMWQVTGENEVVYSTLLARIKLNGITSLKIISGAQNGLLPAVPQESEEARSVS
jgi:hypothetical protein